jgi:hypothetical protein
VVVAPVPFLGMARTVLIELENGTVDSRSRPPTLIKPSKP